MTCASSQSTPTTLTEEAFRALGDGKVAYVKTVMSEDVQRLYPEAPEMDAGLVLYALHTADGTALYVTDTREAAFAKAMSHELEALSAH